jgi:hypothetical protein
VITRVFGSQKRLDSLLGMLRELRDLGVRLSVLSFNSSHIVRKAFTYTEPELLKLFATIKGYEDVGTNQIGLPVGKGESIREIVGAGEEALFVDDSSRNVRDVKEALGERAETVFVDCSGGGGGMQQVHVETVGMWARGELG